MTADQQPGRNLWFRKLGTQQAEPPWTWFDVVQIMLVLLMSVILIGSTAASLMFGGVTTALVLILGWSIGLMVTTLFIVVNSRRMSTRWDALRFVPIANMPVSILLLISVAVAFSIDVVAGLGSGDFRPIAELTGVGANNGDWFIAGFFMMLIQPVSEGIVFFGFILPRLRASVSPYGGWFLTAVLYTFYHVIIYGVALPQDAFVWYGVVLPFLIALYLGMARVRTESTLGVIYAYAAMNITLLLIGFVVAN